MALIEKEEIIRILRGFNPWWTTGQVPPSLAKEWRRIPFYETQRLLNIEQFHRAIILAGPRRVGKTTILYQVAAAEIKKGLDPKLVLYLSLEHPMLKLMKIDEIIDLYDKEIAPTTGKRIVLLDELQYVEEPTVWLKILVDRNPGWKILVTGSASIAFRKQGKESGVGRWVEVPVPTLSFFEYVTLRKMEKDDIRVPILESGIMPTGVGGLPAPQRRDMLSRLKPLKGVFNDFLLQGGFPETARLDLPMAQKILREDIVDKVLKRDMTAFYKIRKIQELERLFVYLCVNTGTKINEEVVGTSLGIKRPTLRSFLESLEGAHLIRRIVAFDVTGKKVLKGRAKWYVVDASIRNAVLLKAEDVFQNPTELGLVVEAATINQLASYSYPVRPRFGYWKSPKRDKEVDLVIDTPGMRPIAVEVKYREQAQLGAGEGIYQYLSIRPDTLGLVVTKDAEDFETQEVVLQNGQKLSVTTMPAYAFLYLLGHFEYERTQDTGNPSP